MNIAREPQLMTVEDFDALDEENDQKRYELIDGVIHLLSSPSAEHTECQVNLLRDISTSLLTAKSKCRCYNDFNLQIDTHNVIKPDIMVICDRDQLTSQRFFGVPLIVIEILSPSTRRNDMLYKLNKYHDIGVSEYWLADPAVQTLTVYDFANDDIILYTLTDTVQSKAMPEIGIPVSRIFM